MPISALSRRGLGLCAVVAACGVAPLLHAEPSSVQPGREPEVAAPAASVVARALELFPQAKGWFALVADARFDASAEGALSPRWSALSHPRVRFQDGAGFHLTVAFPPSLARPMRVASASDPERRYVMVSALAARAVPAVVDRGLVTYAGAYLDTDVLYKATPTHVDEYLLLRSDRAPRSFRYRIALGPGLVQLRQAGSLVEAVDAQGRPWLRVSRPFAVDRAGKRFLGDVAVSRDELHVTIDLHGAQFPVLLDPDWKATGDMAYGRFFHRVNELPDGRVLATGGCSAAVCSGDLKIGPCRTVVSAVEALDVESQLFSSLPDSAEPRYFHVAESLPSGDVLLAGGCSTPTCAVTASAEIISAVTGTITAAPALPQAGAGHASAVLPDGRVLVAGGCDTAACSERVFAFDEKTKRWEELAPLHEARGRAGVSVTTEGRVLVTGGCTTIECAGVLASAELYDPATDTWEQPEAMKAPRAGHYQVSVEAGRVLVGGGCAEQSCATVHRSTELFEPTLMHFHTSPDGLRPRFGALATLLPNGDALISQGCTDRNVCDLTNELYDSARKKFSMLEPAVTTRAFHAVVVHSQHLVIANGGCQPGTCSWWNEYYDLNLVDGGVPADAGAGMDGGVARDAGGVPGPTTRPAKTDDGCSCSVAGAAPGGSSRWLALLVAGAVLALRRVRARRLLLGVGLFLGCGDDDTDGGLTDAGLDAATIDAATDAGRPRCGDGRVAQLASGWSHLFAIDDQGSTFSWGANNEGELGVCDTKDRTRPTPMDSQQWARLAGGSRHSCGVQADGLLFCWGVNVHGQLGTGGTTSSTMAEHPVSDAKWKDVACGGLHSCGVRVDGTLWCWGANPAGQLGLGDMTGDRLTPQQVGTGADWERVFARARFTCGLKRDQTLHCFGDNSNGQVGVGDTADHRAPLVVAPDLRFTDVGPGPLHDCAITTDRALYCWGSGASGKLGLGDSQDRPLPERVGDATDWDDVSGGFDHTCGVRAGALYCWGANYAGQLGLGDTDDRLVPTLVDDSRTYLQVAAGMSHSCALDDRGQVACFGEGGRGQLGDATTNPRASPAPACFPD